MRLEQYYKLQDASSSFKIHLPPLIISGAKQLRGLYGAEGTVFQSGTARRIPGAAIKVFAGSKSRDKNPRVFKSDSLGNFEVQTYFGGCMPHCPDMEIEFSADSFQTKIISVSHNQSGKINVFLDK
jgi:hypothetical protein